MEGEGGGLAGAVVDEAGYGDVGGEGGDGQDQAVVGSDHGGEEGTGEAVVGEGVDGEEAREGGVGGGDPLLQ